MSLQSALDFTVAVAKDPNLTTEVGSQLKGKSPDDSAKTFAALGKSKGYDFTAAEANEARSQAMRVAELSEEDLDKVAGGFGTQDAVNMGITMATSRAIGVPIAGGIVGAGVASGFDSLIHGGSASDVANSFVSGMQNACNNTWNTTKSVVDTIFSGW